MISKPGASGVTPAARSVAAAIALPAGQAGVALAFMSTAGLDVWGQVVGIQVAVYLAAHGVSWGGTDSLVKDLSASPGDFSVWWRAIATRTVFLLPLALAATGAAVATGPTLALAAIWLASQVARDFLEPVITIRRRFGTAAIADGGTLGAVALVATQLGTGVTQQQIVGLLAAAAAARALLLWAALAPRPFTVATPSWRWLQSTAPYFGISVIGLLQSRADLILAALLLPPEQLAVYSLLASGIRIARAVVAALIRPFAAACHRLPRASLNRLAVSQLRVGAPAATLVLISVLLVGRHAVDADVSMWWIAIALIIVAPLSWRLPWTLHLFTKGRDRSVMAATAVAGAISALLAIPLLRTHGVAGGLSAAATGEVLLVGLTFWLAAPPRRARQLVPA